nr:hypothetical protein [Tolivirales sp.]
MGFFDRFSWVPCGGCFDPAMCDEDEELKHDFGNDFTVHEDGSYTIAQYEGPVHAERLYKAKEEQHPQEVAKAAPAVPAVNPANDDAVAMEIPHFRKSLRKRVVRSAKRAVLTALWQSEAVACWRREDEMKKELRKEMLTTLHLEEGLTSVKQVVAEAHTLNAERVHHIPRLTVEVVIALRCKLGMGAQDRRVPGNVAVVRAEAAKMMREWNVRHKDAAAHLAEIERCFFEDDSHYRITTWRARLASQSKFVAWFIGKSEPVGFDY